MGVSRPSPTAACQGTRARSSAEEEQMVVAGSFPAGLPYKRAALQAYGLNTVALEGIVTYLKEKKDASSCRRRGSSEREAVGDSDEEGDFYPVVR